MTRAGGSITAPAYPASLLKLCPVHQAFQKALARFSIVQEQQAAQKHNSWLNCNREFAVIGARMYAALKSPISASRSPAVIPFCKSDKHDVYVVSTDELLAIFVSIIVWNLIHCIHVSVDALPCKDAKCCEGPCREATYRPYHYYISPEIYWRLCSWLAAYPSSVWRPDLAGALLPNTLRAAAAAAGPRGRAYSILAT